MRPPDRRVGRLPRLALAGVLLCAPALAARAEEAPEQRLKSVEKAIESGRSKEAALAKEAAALAAELATLRADGIAAAEAAQAHEAALTRLDARLAALEAEETRKSEEIAAKRAAEAALLMALARFAGNPPDGLALAPGEPVDLLRGARLLGAAVPPLAARAQALRDEVAALAALRGEIGRDRAEREAERLARAREEARIAGLVAKKAALEQRALSGLRQSERRQVQLAAQAKDLRELIARLEAERKAREEEEERRHEAERRAEAERLARLAEPRAAHPGRGLEVTAPAPVVVDPTAPRVIRPFRQAKGAMVFPASGTLERRFGETDEVGVAAKGLTITTRAGARIVAPFDGRVEFAGTFQGYGQILIIGHGDGYHSLLAGLLRVEDGVGQWLVAGEPVGVMPDGERPRLYLELRHDGQPVDPLPWLAARDEKVSG